MGINLDSPSRHAVPPPNGYRQTDESRSPPLRVGAGVSSQIDLADVAAVKVRVKLSGRDVGMAEEFLDDAQIRPSLEHVGGKAVTEAVRSNTG